MTLWYFVIVTFVFVSLSRSDTFDEDDDDDDFVPFTGHRRDRFDWALCRTLDERQEGNVIASPLSIKLLLAMIYEGSTGTTARELEETLQLSNSRTATRYMNSAILKNLQAPNKNFELSIASRMYLDRGMTAKNWYKRILALYYESYIDNVSFEKPLLTLHEINQWVNSVTRGHINKLITDPGTLVNSRFVLVNTVFFSAAWKKPFNRDASFNANFITPDGHERVMFMSQNGLYYYVESQELRSKILRLPYKGNKFAMYVILPNEHDGLNQLLKKINPFVLRRYVSQMEQTSVSVTLPSFHFDFTVNINDALKEVGVNGIFENFNDMRGIMKSKTHKGIVVSKIFQKATIKVTERGTEVAAASTVQFIDKISLAEVDFNASHPFLFLIEDETTGTVIFVGKLVYPQIQTTTLNLENTSGNEMISQWGKENDTTIASSPEPVANENELGDEGVNHNDVEVIKKEPISNLVSKMNKSP